MRPGPGLVVMALAFISGARRGTSQLSGPRQGGIAAAAGDDDDDTGTLARINPWLSACDLAQPNSAPDLQGQCSAGKLPVAWVNEGPGPPECPLSCETLRLHEKNHQQQHYLMDTNNNNKNNKNKNRGEANMGNRFNIEDKQLQQCLDYFGDNEDSSPAQLCKKSSRDITTKLRTLRLRHCCERTAMDAIHNEALAMVKQGGPACVRSLTDLLDADALASRITCELNEILLRYDCRQLYSIKHGCRDCKEAYRRWVCSTLIPYFAEPDDIRQNSTVNRNGNPPSSTNTTQNSKSSSRPSSLISKTSIVNVRQSVNTGLVDHEEDPVVSRLLKRSRRKSESTRKKIRPCLSVCQAVEENCPYMLPGDRAPAHPTQYAGEPTFLCLDPNIPETGDQLAKSNSGPDNCCYRYCSGSVYDGLCPYCDLPTNKTSRTAAAIRDDTMVPPEECPSLLPASDASISTEPRCKTPYQASSLSVTSSSSPTAATSPSSLSSNRIASSKYYYYTWTISWSLLNVAAWTTIRNVCIQLAAAGS